MQRKMNSLSLLQDIFFFFSETTVLMGGVWLKIHVGQSTEAFDFLRLTTNRSQIHERKKEEEENASLNCM